MKTKLCAWLVAGSLAVPALAGYGKEDTQIMLAFGSGANNARLYAEVLAQAEQDRPGKPSACLQADRVAGISAGAMLAAFLTLPHHSDGRPLSAGETLKHMASHGSDILAALRNGLSQSDKAVVQARVREHMAAALGSNAKRVVSDLPYQTDLMMVEVAGEDLRPATFSAMTAILGEVPDVSLAQALTAAVAVEDLAGQVSLGSGGQETKETRKFMDAGGVSMKVAGRQPRHDPTPELIRAAVSSGKPAHIFAFEGGFGFDQETLDWAKGTREAEKRSAKGEALGEAEAQFGRVRVHLFEAGEAEHWACAACGNPEGKLQAPCQAHGLNLAQLVGKKMPLAKFAYCFDQRLSVADLARNLQSGFPSLEVNAELARVAHTQLIGPEGARTASYQKLLAVLAEADGSQAGSGAAAGAVETKADGESKAAKS